MCSQLTQPKANQDFFFGIGVVLGLEEEFATRISGGFLPFSTASCGEMRGSTKKGGGER